MPHELVQARCAIVWSNALKKRGFQQGARSAKFQSFLIPIKKTVLNSCWIANDISLTDEKLLQNSLKIWRRQWTWTLQKFWENLSSNKKFHQFPPPFASRHLMLHWVILKIESFIYQKRVKRYEGNQRVNFVLFWWLMKRTSW